MEPEASGGRVFFYIIFQCKALSQLDLRSQSNFLLAERGENSWRGLFYGRTRRTRRTSATRAGWQPWGERTWERT